LYENDAIGENLLCALDVTGAPSDKAILTEQWQLYQLNYFKRCDKLAALSDKDIVDFGFLYLELDRDEIDKLGDLLKHRVRKCDSSLQQKLYPGVEPTSVEYLAALGRECCEVKPQYDALLSTIGCSELKLASLKDPRRYIPKARLGYGDDYRCILDIIRGSIICQDASDMRRVVQQFLNAVEEADRQMWEVARYKNRFARAYDALNSRGYRDLNMNVRHIPTGIVTEVQFHIRSFFEYDKRTGGHEKYEIVR
jgi:hypothetical protein